MSALYELQLAQGTAGPVGSFRLRFRPPGGTEVRELHHPLPAQPSAPSPALRLQRAAARLALAWRAPHEADREALRSELEVLRQLPEPLGASPQVGELAGLYRVSLVRLPAAP